MNFRKAGKVKAPEVPASSAVVTPLRHAIGVRLNSVRSNVGKHVRVHVNEAGRNDLPGGIDHLARLPGGNIAFQARDFAVANGHVAKIPPDPAKGRKPCRL